MSLPSQGLGLSGGALGTSHWCPQLELQFRGWFSFPTQGQTDKEYRQAWDLSRLGAEGLQRLSLLQEKYTYLSFSENDPGCASIPRKVLSLTIQQDPSPICPLIPSPKAPLILWGTKRESQVSSLHPEPVLHTLSSERHPGVNPVPMLSRILRTLVFSATALEDTPLPPPAPYPKTLQNLYYRL